MSAAIAAGPLPSSTAVSASRSSPEAISEIRGGAVDLACNTVSPRGEFELGIQKELIVWESDDMRSSMVDAAPLFAR